MLNTVRYMPELDLETPIVQVRPRVQHWQFATTTPNHSEAAWRTLEVKDGSLERSDWEVDFARIAMALLKGPSLFQLSS